MKKGRKGLFIGIVGIAVVLICALTAQNASSLIAGSRHDLSLGGYGGFQYDTPEPCVFCHTPHAANINQTYVLDPTSTGSAGTLNGRFLWNRALPNRTWLVYQSPTMDHDNSSGPGPTSLLCLSCHDGVGAMNVLLNYPEGGQPADMSGLGLNQFGDFAPGDSTYKLNIGGAVCDGGTGTACTSGGDDLRNDHPIGFVYNSALDTGLKPITNPILQTRMVITGNRVECSTCHDPHMTNNTFPRGNNFLVIANDTGSTLCLECHNK